jgi:hypothetical protein
MKVPAIRSMTRFAAVLRGFGPSVAVGLLVPGGSLILVSLWAYRSWQSGSLTAHLRIRRREGVTQ